jgi:hypothetical protein
METVTIGIEVAKAHLDIGVLPTGRTWQVANTPEGHRGAADCAPSAAAGNDRAGGVAPVQWRDYDLVMQQILRVAYPLSNATGLSVSESAVVG